MTGRWRGADAFIAAWLAFQIILPLAAGLDFSKGRYFFGPFTWSMYSHRELRCEASLWVVDDGVRRDVEGLGRLMKRAPGAQPERCRFGYPKEGAVEAKFKWLVDEIAAQRADGRRYGAEIRWTRLRDPDWPPVWRYETQSPGAAR